MARIVVGIDGSEHAQKALEWAAREARMRNAELEVVYAWQMPMYIGYGVVSAPVFDVSELRNAAKTRVDEAVAALNGDATGVAIETKAIEGISPEILVDEAKDADLLVVGSRGHGGFTGLLLGSVGQQCAQHSLCPTVIVRD